MKIHPCHIYCNISDQLRVISELPAGVGCKHLSSTSAAKTPSWKWQPLGEIIQLITAAIIIGGSNAGH